VKYTLLRISKDVSGYYGGCVFLCQAVSPEQVSESILVNRDSGRVFDALLALVAPGTSEVVPPDPLVAEIETVAEFDVVPGPSYTRRVTSGSLVPFTVSSRPKKEEK